MRTVYLLVAAASCTGAWAQPNAPATEAPKPPLAIELGANLRTRADVFVGTPVVLTVVLRNAPAVEAETAKAALESVKASIDAAVAGKTMEADEAAAMLAAQRPPADAP